MKNNRLKKVDAQAWLSVEAYCPHCHVQDFFGGVDIDVYVDREGKINKKINQKIKCETCEKNYFVENIFIPIRKKELSDLIPSIAEIKDLKLVRDLKDELRQFLDVLGIEKLQDLWRREDLRIVQDLISKYKKGEIK